MKNTITLNIGLNTPTGTLTVPEVATALRRHGLILTASRLAVGRWEGKEEQTLAVECLPALPLCHNECRAAVAIGIGKLARELGQACVALQWPEGHGELHPNVGKFDPAEFKQVFTPAPVVTCPVEAVISACKHQADIAEDNDEPLVRDNYLYAAEFLRTNREALAAVIAPAPAPAPVAAACQVQAVISSLREMLDTFEDNAQYDDDDAEVIARAREALAAVITPARTSEVTSGW